MSRSFIFCSLPLVAAQEWEPPPGCNGKTWSESECCCSFCTSTEQLAFAPLDREECFNQGGQCKAPQMSAYYNRRPKAPRAVPEPTEDGEPEQTHLIGGYPDEVTVVFVTQTVQESKVEFRLGSEGEVQERIGTSDSYSMEIFPIGWQGYSSKYPSPGPEFRNCGPYSYKNASCTYTSGAIHTVKLEGLTPGSKYEYRPQGSKRWRHFTTPPAVGAPVKFGVVADLGQTTDALATMRHMKHALDRRQIDTVLFPGDLSYADGFAPYWDSYGKLSEFLWESVPAAYIVGNHEYGAGLEQNTNFLPRYGWPSKVRSKSISSHWYSFNVGMAHVVMLCSYCDSSPDGLQTTWLKADLESVDRSRTPWLVVSFHAPYYSANRGHVGEAEVLRANIEDLLYKHKADIVLSGHVHAYDRTTSVYKNKTTCDGPVYITIGDGGNHEGPYCGWRDLEWSAFTENSFGYGEFEIANASHAQWRFYRNQDSEAVAADSVWLTPSSKRCNSPVVV
jgi:hypothetical protein